MLRFLSRRRGRGVGGQNTSSQIKNQRLLSNKNIVQCRVVLLDGTDLPIELSVCTLFIIIILVNKAFKITVQLLRFWPTFFSDYHLF